MAFRDSSQPRRDVLSPEPMLKADSGASQWQSAAAMSLRTRRWFGLCTTFASAHFLSLILPAPRTPSHYPTSVPSTLRSDFVSFTEKIRPTRKKPPSFPFADVRAICNYPSSPSSPGLVESKADPSLGTLGPLLPSVGPFPSALKVPSSQEARRTFPPTQTPFSPDRHTSSKSSH